MIPPKNIPDTAFKIKPDVAVCVCTKGGFNSMRMLGVERLSKADAKAQGVKVVMYIREPIERLKSAWAMYTGLKEFPRRDDLPTWEQFIDLVLDGYSEQHWSSQVAQHDFYDEARRLENIDTTWDGPTVGRENKGMYPKPTKEYRLNDLKNYYKDDYKVWNKAK